MAEQFVFVGTYTRKEAPDLGVSEGVYVYRLDLDTGALEHVSTAAGVPDPSYVALDPSGEHLYAANELNEYDGVPGGAVSAFAFDRRTGVLTFLNRLATGGGLPCHLMVDQTDSCVLVANYGGGNVSAFTIAEDGSLVERSDFVQHTGSSVNPQRQKEPHAHSFTIDPGNRFAFAADLGIDKVLSYKLDAANGKLEPNDPPGLSVTPGSGPRHFDFHPNGKFAYLINEIGATITVFAYDGEGGTLSELQTVPTLPEGFDRKSCADIHVSPSGKFVYGSNRGHNTLVVYAIDEATGKLEYVGHESTLGEIPRGFHIDPTGKIVLAGNQDTHNVVTFWMDPETGKLEPTGHEAKVPQPVCIKLLPI
ncbi:MAG: lactonase family protein [bacterium]|nr:lactonase family protein [bacterium]